jgi:hypothetical protein
LPRAGQSKPELDATMQVNIEKAVLVAQTAAGPGGNAVAPGGGSPAAASPTLRAGLAGAPQGDWDPPTTAGGRRALDRLWNKKNAAQSAALPKLGNYDEVGRDSMPEVLNSDSDAESDQGDSTTI